MSSVIITEILSRYFIIMVILVVILVSGGGSGEKQVMVKWLIEWHNGNNAW